jgi:hypothetical protein
MPGVGVASRSAERASPARRGLRKTGLVESAPPVAAAAALCERRRRPVGARVGVAISSEAGGQSSWLNGLSLSIWSLLVRHVPTGESSV